MSKLALDQKVPADYRKSDFVDIFRAIASQVNPLSEGRLAARYQARASVPSSVAAAVGDIVWDSNVTVTNGTARLGWVCNVASLTNATWQEIRTLTGNYLPQLGVEVATTSGTSIDFTGIPAWVTQIEIELVAVSTNGTSSYLVQIGDSGGIETTTYSSVAGSVGNAGSTATQSSSAGYVLQGGSAVAAETYTGVIVLTLEDSSDFTWMSSHNVVQHAATAIACSGSGKKSLSAALDRVRITTVGGADTFDAGVINIRMS